jgi:tetratricopeptide (TPR) repeat protein
VLLGLVGTLIALQRAIDAERLAEARLADATAALERADQQAEIAEAAKAFLTEDLLAAANPDAMGGDAPVREVLRAASERIGERTDLDPLFKSEILLSMGKTLSVAGEFELARGHLEEALAIREELYGDDHLLTVDALKELGSAYVIASQVEPSRVERSKRVLDVRMRDLGPEHNQTLVAMNDYALALDDLNRDDEAIPVYEEAIEMARATLGPDSEREATLLHNFAAVMEQRDAARSEEMYREALRIRAKVLGPEHSRTLLAANSLASFYWSADRLDEAEPIYVETLAARIELLGETHPHTLNSMDNLGTLYLKRGDWDRAMAHTGRALEIIRAEFGPRSFRAARTMNNVAAIHRGMGDYAEAERIFGEAYDILRSQDGRELYAGWIRRNQGHMLWELERYDEAESAMVEAVAVLSEVSGDGDFRTRSALTLLGDFYEDRGRTDEAAATRARLGD